MADQGPRYRSLTATGLGAEAAGAVVDATLRSRDDLDVHEVAPGRLLVSRTRRPGWALVACVATVWLGGLGLLFLLVRQTEAGEVVVTDGPRGCTITVPPLLDGPTVHAIEVALRGGGAAPATATPAPAAPPADDDLEGRTVARGASAGGGTATPATPTVPPGAVLRFAGDAVTVEVGRPVVLGRDPSPTGGAVGRRVPGDATTVSKSHLRVDFDGTTLTVEDLGSTNGTTLTHDDAARALPAGTRTPVVDGDRVALGAVELVVELRATPRRAAPAWT